LIFVDTSFWVALTNRRDARHSDAAGIARSACSKVTYTSSPSAITSAALSLRSVNGSSAPR
jgi:predicted nucleic acid-binding protein